jgi:4'-phosphopantetheinyl transferase EntD
VLTPNDQAGLASAPSAQQSLLAKIIFSAKEAYYKAQFPLSARRLSFQDVDVALDTHRSTFEIALVDPTANALASAQCLGRYVTDAKLLLTGVVIVR